MSVLALVEERGISLADVSFKTMDGLILLHAEQEPSLPISDCVYPHVASCLSGMAKVETATELPRRSHRYRIGGLLSFCRRGTVAGSGLSVLTM